MHIHLCYLYIYIYSCIYLLFVDVYACMHFLAHISVNVEFYVLTFQSGCLHPHGDALEIHLLENNRFERHLFNICFTLLSLTLGLGRRMQSGYASIDVIDIPSIHSYCLHRHFYCIVLY